MNARNLSRIATHLRDLAPYFLLALALPGGSIVALLLWLRQRGDKGDVT